VFQDIAQFLLEDCSQFLALDDDGTDA